MHWFLKLLFTKSEYIWVPVRILKETDKAILVDNCRKFWIAKSRIVKIRLRAGSFEIYVKEAVVR